MNHNIRAAKIIVDQLIKLGVNYFCLSPGSRSAPLALAIAEHPKAEGIVHFDERGTAFHALGYAKATGKPAVIVTTSGTAVGNLLPAIMEASNTNVPLLILTADRPPELQDCGSNQTIDQVKIFHDFVRWQTTLPCPDSAMTDRYLKSTLAYALSRCLQPAGPVHLNCMLREPLVGPCEFSLPDEIVSYGTCEAHPHAYTLESWAEMLNSTQEGVIIVGELPQNSSYSEIHALAEKLGWPIFPDIISGMRFCEGNVVPHYDLIIKTWKDKKIDTVLHFGDRFVSKATLEWLERSSPEFYFSVSDHPFRHDPKHLVTHRLACKPSLFCEKILPFISSSHPCTAFWKEAGEQIASSLEEKFSSLSEITEPGIAYHLSAFGDSAIFLANSMPVRDADFFFFPQNKMGPIFANRGVSGIDGNIATVFGLAQGCKKPTVAVLGDLATLHDLNSLAQAKNCEYPVFFVIINNAGGGVFSFLPHQMPKDTFEQYFAVEHALRFEKAAEMFGIPYYSPKTNCQDVFQDCLLKNQTCIIEIFTKRDENYLLHQEIQCSLSQLQVN